MLGTGLVLFLGLAGALQFVAGLRLIATLDRQSRLPALALLAFGCCAILAHSWFADAELTVRLAALTSLFSVCLAMSVRASVHGVAMPAAIILPAVLAFGLNIGDALLNPTYGGVELLGRSVPALAYLALVPVLCTRGFDWKSFGAGIAPLIGFAVAFGAFSPRPWLPCSIFKCGILENGILAGPFASGNTLASIALCSLIAAAAGQKKKFRNATALLSLAAIFLANSRTSLVAIAAAAAIAMIPHAVGRRWPARFAPYALVSGIVGVGCVLLIQADSASFSNRGAIWRKGIQALEGHWLVGRGQSTWSQEVLARNYMHSEQLLFLYAAGIVGLVAFVWIMAEITTLAWRYTAWKGIAVMMLFLVRGLTEVSWNPLAFDSATLMLVTVSAFAAAGHVASRTSPAHDELLRPADDALVDPGARRQYKLGGS